MALLALVAASPFARPFSHDDWATVLAERVDPAGRVDYAGLALDRADLDRYLDEIAQRSPYSEPGAFPDRAHELAYWINAYNALVFAGVLDRGPESDSVWRGGLVPGYRFFVKRKVVLGGMRTNLRKLENEFIRADYDDPRIHAALNCASIGCPRLPQEIFDWFGEDFEAHADSVSSYINRYRGESEPLPSDYRIQTIPYDRTINAR